MALASFLVVLALAFQTRTESVAISYVFGDALQPSTLGSLGLLATIWLFVGGRYLASGLALAASGAFHANYLVLGIACFGFAHLTFGLRGLGKRWLHQLGPALAAFALLLPVFLATAADPQAREGQRILFEIRSPHHYLPATFLRGFVPVAAVQAIAFGAYRRAFTRLPQQRHVGALLAALMVLVWSGTFLTTRIFEPRVAQLFVWRFAPFLDLLCQIVAAIALTTFLCRPFLRRWPAWPTPLLVAVGVTLMALYPSKGHQRYADLLTGGALLALLVFGASLALRRFRLSTGMRWWSRWAPPVALFCAAVLAAWSGKSSVASFPERSSLLRQESSTGQLYRWIREHTPKEAVLLTPPWLEGFRFHGQRAIVVDWKSAPMIPSDVVAWYERVRDAVGRDVSSYRDTSAYKSLDATRVSQLRNKYRVTHFVTIRGREGGVPGRVIYRNADFVVMEL